MDKQEVADSRLFAYRMARFELGRVRSERTAGRESKAAVALKRALLWRRLRAQAERVDLN